MLGSSKKLVAVGIGLGLPISLLSHSGCKRDEPPPPMPSAAAEYKPSTQLVLEIEDAGVPELDAGPDVKKRGYASGSSMRACCAALRQNAASAPAPTQTLMMTAASACDLAVAQGKDGSSIASIVARALGGTSAPPMCNPPPPPPPPGRSGSNSV